MRNIFFTYTSILFMILIIQCSNDSNSNQQENYIKKIPVKIMKLSPKHFSEYLQITGIVEARNRIQIVAEEGGTLHKVIKDKGSIVKKGDVLAIIQNKILEASFNEAKAALGQAELDYSSKQILFSKKAISENEYLASKFGLERAQAANALNEARYSKLFIKSPMDGYINDRLYDIGAYVSSMTPIFDFIDNAEMKISAGVAERFLDDISIGTIGEITFDALPDLNLQSSVSFINRSIDPMSRTFQIELRVPNPERKLTPQMIANVKLLRRSYENQIVIPLDAVIESEEGRYVFIVDSDNKAKKSPINIRAIYLDSVLVDGLSENQKLVVVGQQELTSEDIVDYSSSLNN
jgi:membrane fusion protein (multidrug efflux system)